MTSRRDLSKLNVLVVDDDPECREFLASVLEGEVKGVVQVGDAESAIDMLRQQGFDIVVTDKNLPQMDGIGLIKFIRESYENLPVILITGQASVGSAVDAFKFGAHDYLLKPLEDPDVLLRTIWSVVEQRRLENENSMLQQKLIHSEKMESLGMLAAGVAHEINNPTGFIMGNLELLKEDIKAAVEVLGKLEDVLSELASPDAAKKAGAMERLAGIGGSPVLKQLRSESTQMINEALDGTQRIKRIVGSLRGFAREDTQTVEPVDLNEEVERALTLVMNDLKYKCEVTKDFQQLPKVMGNSTQIDQVLVNILINAGQAIEGKNGLITVRTYSDSGMVNVEIADNGKGISDEHMEHIFDPFFTTKDVGVGTGLGLYIAYGIMKLHNGSIDVKSKVGEGTKVTLTFPEGTANA
jgi:two-component system, NtrC family, sensor kinase